MVLVLENAHIDLVQGRRWRTMVMPVQNMAKFITERNEVCNKIREAQNYIKDELLS